MRTRSASADSFIETEADKLALDHAGQILTFAEEFEEIMNVCIVPEGLERALRSLLKNRLGIVHWKGDFEQEEEEEQHLEQIEEEQTDEEKEEEDQEKPEIAPPTTEFMADSVSPSPTSRSNTSSDASEQAQTATATSPSLTTPSYTKVAPHQLLTIMSGMPDVEAAMRLLEYLQQNVSAAIAAGLPNFRVGDMDFNYYSQRVLMSWGYVDVPLVYIEDEEEEYEDEHENQHENESEDISDEETSGDVGAEMSGSPLMAIQQEESSEQDQSESEVEEEETDTSRSPLISIQEEGSPELGESDNESELEEGEIIEL
ncbi:hypothetical protein D6C91_08567 [Aureobasidium pullulans]|uniref:Uncharacterized protein n=1 Tax=Aureobasidium pullulans TaxID=5580 RepID=A0A4S9SMS5_AURPU|nr:hypothetical protein D6C91_08567 [Aureobasidium pullulans]